MTYRQIHLWAGGVLSACLLVLIPGAVGRAHVNGPSIPAVWDVALASGYAISIAGLAFACITRRDPRVWAAAVVVTTSVGLLAFPWIAMPLTGDGPPWVAMFAPTAAAACGLVARAGVAGAMALVLTLCHVWAQRSEMWSMTAERDVADVLFILVCAGAGVAAMETLRARARLVRVAAQKTTHAAINATRQQVEAAETAHWDALLHDEILATLESAASHAVERDDVRGMATRAIEALSTSARDVRDVVPRDVVERLRVLSDLATCRITVDSDARAVPAVVAESLGTAVAEAARNSVRHSDGRHRAAVTGRISAEGVQILVRDHGPGFDPQRLPHDRLGLVVSVRGGMRAVGGSARIDSRPGRGTTVRLRWPVEAA